jgi:hypothetical protein
MLKAQKGIAAGSLRSARNDRHDHPIRGDVAMLFTQMLQDRAQTRKNDWRALSPEQPVSV